MDADALTPSQFIRAADFGVTLDARPTLTITQHGLEEMFSFKQGAEETMIDKGVIRFKEVKQGWVANKTNVACLVALFGKDANKWHGKRVTLATEHDSISKKMAIRVVGSPDITTPVKAVIQLPRRRPIERTLKPTGTNQANAAKPLDAFLDAVVAQLGLDRERVFALAASEGLALASMSHEDLRKVYARLSPGKDLRAKYDAPPADQGGDQDEELPPGEGRAFGDDATDDTP